MLGRAVLVSVLSIGGLQLGPHAVSAQAPEEWVQVTQEACGSRPQARCLTELRKVCHEHPTFRCYYSRKDRMDAIRQVEFPAEEAHDDEW